MWAENDGYKPPFIPGADVSGVIEKLGSKVASMETLKHLEVGQRVYSLTRHGAYTTHAVLDAQMTFCLNDKLSFAQGCALGVPYFTAIRSIVLL